MRKTLKPAIDALDLAIGQDASISNLRGQLMALRDQAEAIESEREIFKAERDDFEAQLNEARQEIRRLGDEIEQWQQAHRTDGDYPEGSSPVGG